MAEKLMTEIEPAPSKRSTREGGQIEVVPVPPRQLRKGIRIHRIRLRNGIQQPNVPRLNRMSRQRYRAPNIGLESRRMYFGLIGVRFRDLGRRIMSVITFGAR